ncbi:MAG: AbrB/MazE/SpoVT family DNA-binding domain-containing protein [Candidatus Paceibacterota bacterium]
MTTTVQKWGNSLGIRIPKDVAEAIGAQEGKVLLISTQHQKMIIELAPQKKIDIEKLLKKITPKNSHDEIEWGDTLGEEVW